MRQPELFDHLLVGSRLFQRIQGHTVQVFQQCIAEHIIIRSGFDDGGNRLQPSQLRSTPTAFTHNELIRAVQMTGKRIRAGFRLVVLGGFGRSNPACRTLAHDYRLQHTNFLNGSRQLIQLILVEDGTRLMCIGPDIRQFEFSQITTGYRLELVLLICVSGLCRRCSLRCFT